MLYRNIKSSKLICRQMTCAILFPSWFDPPWNPWTTLVGDQSSIYEYGCIKLNKTVYMNKAVIKVKILIIEEDE